LRALIVAAGSPPERELLDRSWPGWDDGIGLVVAADAGADTAARLGLRVDLAVGDFDSLSPDGLARLRAAGVPVERAPAAKDESDTELAIRAALSRGSRALTILGGLGGRPDHLLANVGLLALADLAGLPAVLLDDRTRVSLVRGPGSLELSGRVGDLVSLLPLGARVDGVTTSGLAWRLDDEALPIGPARGLSNVRDEPVVRVSVRVGLLLVVETAIDPASDRLPP
jgi:thiamine pyrophosphokinase